MSDSNDTETDKQKPRTPRGSAAKLASRAEKLRAELEATEKALRQKQQALAARQQAQAKKDRTHNLIIGGLIYESYIKTLLESASQSTPPKTDALKASIFTQLDRYFASLPAETDKQRARIERDKVKFVEFIKPILDSFN